MRRVFLIGLVIAIGLNGVVFAGGDLDTKVPKIKYNTEFKSVLDDRDRYRALYYDALGTNERLQHRIDVLLSGDDELTEDGVDYVITDRENVKNWWDQFIYIGVGGFFGFILGNIL